VIFAAESPACLVTDRRLPPDSSFLGFSPGFARAGFFYTFPLPLRTAVLCESQPWRPWLLFGHSFLPHFSMDVVFFPVFSSDEDLLRGIRYVFLIVSPPFLSRLTFQDSAGFLIVLPLEHFHRYLEF